MRIMDNSAEGGFGSSSGAELGALEFDIRREEISTKKKTVPLEKGALRGKEALVGGSNGWRGVRKGTSGLKDHDPRKLTGIFEGVEDQKGELYGEERRTSSNPMQRGDILH